MQGLAEGPDDDVPGRGKGRAMRQESASSIDFLAFFEVAWMFACREKGPLQLTRQHRAGTGPA